MQEKIKPITKTKRSGNVQKFKGLAKIELFENGKKVQEVVEENMFTNALDNVFNPRRFLVMNEPESDLLQNQNIKSNALAGVLLYENTIEENANTLYAPLDNPMTGCAGSSYSGADTRRGSFNSNESGFIDPEDYTKGYRWVFDFGTDKANGKIGCIALTSHHGGDVGYGANRCVNAYSQYPAFLRRTDFSYDNSLNSNYGSNGLSLYLKRNTTSNKFHENMLYYLGETGDGFSKFFYNESYDNTTHTFKLLEIPTENFKIGLTNTTDWRSVTAPDITPFKREYTFVITRSTSNWSGSSYYDIAVRGSKVYLIFYKTAASNLITEWEYFVFDSIARTMSTATTIIISPGIYQSYPMFVPFNNGWIGLGYTGSSYDLYYYPSGGGTGDRLYFYDKITTAGGNDVTGSYQYPSSRPSCSIEVQGGLIFETNGNAGIAGISTDFEKVMYIQSSSGVTPRAITQILENGDCIHSITNVQDSNSSRRIYFYGDILSGYIATINNLLTPVTKTNAQTMKITYEVTVAEESDET